ncbi:sensor domain-containing diguanylate cyclase [Marinobacterium lutimaris]|uniref:diguanylate cyclase n=1 Tax=Marinobacterium lutimaris TaxID=568106 RepID=A0A1H6B4Y0_9GAMM|nr:diguanylate cyclase [Marinobacterium lutimaris]SEG55903.1 diguanylate cyclase (GGDEF) domain-containing protein [Marinobacterium lutimaris]
MPDSTYKRRWLNRFAPTSLSGRFFAGLFALLLLALLAILLTGKLIVLPKLLIQERETAIAELKHLDHVIHADLHDLVISTKDWGAWDDSYNFIQGLQSDYPARNFSFEMFNDMDYDLMLFFTPDLQLYWTAGIDFATEQYSSCAAAEASCAWSAPFAAITRNKLAALPMDKTDHNEQGEPESDFLFNYKGELFNAAVHPIRRTDDTGRSKGSVVQLQRLDEKWIEKITDQTSQKLTLQLYDPQDPNTVMVTPLSDQLLLARKQLSGTDLPVFISTEIQRSNFLERLAAMRYSQIWTAGLLATVILLVLALLERTVLLPLRQLARFTREARAEMNEATLSSALLERRDEVGELAREFAHLIQQQQMKRTSLENLSLTDHLTALANRRCFDDRLKALFGKVEHKGQPVAAILFDVDHFKAYNDRYGHQAGDQCLIMLSDCAQRVVRTQAAANALLARIGGEEFAVILPEVEESQALELAEAIRHGIEALSLRHEDAARGFVTISCGISYLEKISAASSSDLLKTADDALYRAKHQGRNQVMSDRVASAKKQD